MTAGEEREPGLPGLDPPADWREPGRRLKLDDLLHFRDLVDQPRPPDPPPVTAETIREALEAARWTVAAPPDIAEQVTEALAAVDLVDVVVHPAVPEGKVFMFRRGALERALRDWRPARVCTGLSARWCPVHGACLCFMDPATFDGDLDSPHCPLHAPTSEHAEGPVEP